MALFGGIVELSQLWTVGRITDPQAFRWAFASGMATAVGGLCLSGMFMYYVQPSFSTAMAVPPVSGPGEFLARITGNDMIVRIALVGAVAGSIAGFVIGVVRSGLLTTSRIPAQGWWILAYTIGGALDGGVFSAALWAWGNPVSPEDALLKIPETIFVAGLTPMVCALFGPLKDLLAGAVLVYMLNKRFERVRN